MIEKFYDNKWFLGIFSLILTLLLAVFVYIETNESLLASNSNISEVAKERIDNVSVHVVGDNNDMYVTGLPEAVSVELTGPQNVINQTMEAQDFEVVTEDISKYGVGTHYIQLDVRNLSREVTAKVIPSRVQVHIEQQVTQVYDVQVAANQMTAAAGYQITNYHLNPAQVEISGAASTIQEIADVYINVRDLTELTKNTQVDKTIIVEDANGNKLDVVTEPLQVQLSVDVQRGDASIPIALQQIGEPVNGYIYELAVDGTDAINVTGDNATIKNLSNYPIPVDISGMTESSTQTIPVPLLEGITGVNPESITVNIQVRSVDKGTTNNQRASEREDEESASDDSSEQDESSTAENESTRADTDSTTNN